MAWEGLNRRNFPRVIYPCLVKIKGNSGEQESFLTHTENIGGGGLCVIIKKEIKLFTEVVVELDLLDAEDHMLIKGRVVWSVRRKSGEDHKPLYYDVGVEFKDLSDEQKQRLRITLDLLIKKGAKLLKPYV